MARCDNHLDARTYFLMGLGFRFVALVAGKDTGGAFINVPFLPSFFIKQSNSKFQTRNFHGPTSSVPVTTGARAVK